jgi:chemotaxis protein histidine kinase CheA
LKGWENNSDFMVKKEIVSAANLKKEIEEAKAELVSQNKKLKLSVKTEAKKKAEAKNKAEAKKKAVAKKKAEAKKKVEAKKKAVAKKKAEAKKKVDKKKAEAKKKVEAKKKEEEAKKKEEEAKKKEEEAKRTPEEELEEQLTEEEIIGFQIDKTDMDKLVNRVTEMIASYATKGILQNILWRKLKLSSRDGSRLALKLERMGNITREKILENGRWTYLLLIKKIPISTKSIENAPCLVCPVEGKCATDGEISPKTCVYIEDWVLTELKTKKRHETD